jgi:hypothetical protein
MAIQASFAKKLSGSQNGDYAFLSLFGNHRDLELSLLDVKDSVCDVALREDDLILLVFGYRFSAADLGKEHPGVERSLTILPHNGLLNPARAIAKSKIVPKGANMRRRRPQSRRA